MKNIRSREIIKSLNLEKHPEGGWYCETYRSASTIELERGQRSLATLIYFMLEQDEFSAFHRLKSDEFWYYHEGSSLSVHIFNIDGSYELKKLGLLGSDGSRPQLLLPAGCLFAAECIEKDSYSLISCSVHPGFDFLDFELAGKSEMLSLFPDHADIIERLCIKA